MDKPIYIFNKPRSRQKIEISVDREMDPDGWFLRINYIEIKTNKVISSHCIILKDLENWLRTIKKDGWLDESENRK